MPAELASANAADAADFTRALTGQGCFPVLDNFSRRDEHVELLALPNLRMIKLEPAMAAQMHTDRWLQKKVASVGRSTRAMGLKIVVKRMPTRAAQRGRDRHGIRTGSLPPPVHAGRARKSR